MGNEDFAVESLGILATTEGAAADFLAGDDEFDGVAAPIQERSATVYHTQRQ